MLSQAESGESRNQHVQWRKVSTHVSATVVKPASSDNCWPTVDSVWRMQVSIDIRFHHMKPKFDNTLKNSLNVSAPPKMHYDLNKLWTLIKRQPNPVPYTGCPRRNVPDFGEGVPYVKVYRYNPKHLCPKLNGYGDNGQRSLKLWQLLHTCWLPNTY